MTIITTVPVTCKAIRPDGSAIAKGVIRFLLSAPDTENGVVIPQEIRATADETGTAIAELWPNSKGGAGTTYRVLVNDPLGGITSLGSCTVPDSPCNLWQIIDLGPAATIDAATLAKIAAQAFSVDASNSAIAAHADRILSDADVVLTHADVVLTHADVVQTGLDRAQTGSDRVQTGLDRTQTGLDKAATSADRTQSDLDAIATAADRTQTGADRVQTGLDKVATAADRVQTGLDKVATAADRVQTGQDKTATAADRVQTGLDKTSTTSSAATANTKAEEAAGSAAQALAIYGTTAAQQAAVVAAQAAQSAAQGYAASAASVVTQDLSGVAAQALHRSPNAVTALLVYDTSKDSDAGAWTERCQHTSWYNEPLNGKWLCACASESAARAISGATTGDYFQLVSNGGFYKLNATSGVTEVFRGNKAKFPRLSAIVGDQYYTTIYDLTEPGRPMWGRWYNGGYFGTPNTIAAMNGEIIAGSSSGLTQFKIAQDVIWFRQNGSFRWCSILGRTAQTMFPYPSSAWIVNTSVNAVAMTVLPDAPIDPSTGLATPTIAAGTSGGVSVIKNDGTVTNVGTYSANLGNRALAFTQWSLIAGRYASGQPLFWNAGRDSVAFLTVVGNNAWGIWDTKTLTQLGLNQDYWLRPQLFGYSVLSFLKFDRSKGVISSATNGLQVDIYNSYNTGWMVGDIRRVYLSDSVVESVTAPELVTGDNSTFTGGVGSWASSGLFTSTGAAVGGEFQVTLTVAYGRHVLPVATVIGKTYVLTGLVRVVSGSGVPMLGMSAVNNGASAAYTMQGTPSTPTQTRVVFTATGTTSYITCGDNTGPVGGVMGFDDIRLKMVDADRSYKANGAVIYGTLTKSLSSPSASNQLVAYSGFSAANYLQEPASTDLDFGTGEWNVSAWVNIPVTLPVSSFPVVGTNSIPAFSLSDWFVSNADATHIATFSGGTLRYQSDTTTPVMSVTTIAALVTIGKSYLVTAVCSAYVSGGVKVFENVGGFLQVTGLGTFSTIVTCTSTIYPAIGRLSVNTDLTLSSVTIKEVGISSIADRSYSSGAGIKLGITGAGFLTATANDGTTTRTVTTTAAYNTASMLKARAVYKTDGSLAIMVNGVQVAVTYGNPLLTLTNTSAVLTIGNSYTLDAPFPGSIALLKLSATAPTAEQRQWMYEQEKQLFRDGAQCLLPDSGAVVDLAYDEVTDKWIAASAANESSWTGLVRTGVTAVPAGANLKVQAGGGVKLNARSTTSPGVDVTIPAYGLREELVKRAEAAARLSRLIQTFDYIGGFTATTVTGNTAVTSVAGSGYPAQTTVKGAIVTGSGIPASTYIVDLVSTTAYLSAKATASASSVQVSFTDFVLPVGYEAVQVSVAGVVKTEGSTKDFTRLFDGFRETIRFGTAPGYTAAVQIRAVRSAT